MIIHPLPVKRPLRPFRINPGDVLQKPFKFMNGEQAVFSCAREALFNGLRLLDNTSGIIHVPAYCCKSILLPVEQLGLDVYFYDVDLNLEPVLDEKQFSERDVLLLIHYFGIPQNMEYILRISKKYDLVFIEDCAHTLPDPEAVKKRGSSGSFSVFSLRKLLPVAEGGVLIVNDTRLQGLIRAFPPGRIKEISWKRQLAAGFDRLSFLIGWRGALSLKKGLKNILGSTDNVFSAVINKNSEPGISSGTIRVIGKTDLQSVANIRRKNYRHLSGGLAGLGGCAIPFPVLPEDAVPQAFPVLVDDPESICSFLKKKGIGAGRWPDKELPDGISWTDFPGSMQWVNRLMLLPLHQDLSRMHLDKIIHVMKKGI